MHGYVNSFKKAYISRSMLKSTNISSTNNKNYQQESLGFSIPKFSNALSVLDYVLWSVHLVTVLN